MNPHTDRAVFKAMECKPPRLWARIHFITVLLTYFLRESFRGHLSRVCPEPSLNNWTKLVLWICIACVSRCSEIQNGPGPEHSQDRQPSGPDWWLRGCPLCTLFHFFISNRRSFSSLIHCLPTKETNRYQVLRNISWVSQYMSSNTGSPNVNRIAQHKRERERERICVRERGTHTHTQRERERERERMCVGEREKWIKRHWHGIANRAEYSLEHWIDGNNIFIQ